MFEHHGLLAGFVLFELSAMHSLVKFPANERVAVLVLAWIAPAPRHSYEGVSLRILPGVFAAQRVLLIGPNNCMESGQICDKGWEPWYRRVSSIMVSHSVLVFLLISSLCAVLLTGMRTPRAHRAVSCEAPPQPSSPITPRSE